MLFMRTYFSTPNSMTKEEIPKLNITDSLCTRTNLLRQKQIDIGANTTLFDLLVESLLSQDAETTLTCERLSSVLYVGHNLFWPFLNVCLCFSKQVLALKI